MLAVRLPIAADKMPTNWHPRVQPRQPKQPGCKSSLVGRRDKAPFDLFKEFEDILV